MKYYHIMSIYIVKSRPREEVDLKNSIELSLEINLISKFVEHKLNGDYFSFTYH
jgi:hypothetical protein